jgi:WD40 repeat protein/DNA-binding SARP family transcriptional activator
MARLSVRLLGPLKVIQDGESVTGFESDKARALLAYLAVETAHPHRREKLAGLLWPDWPEQAARANLRRTLANLRQVIGDRQATPPFLLISRQMIQFNSASDAWIDVMAFTNLLEAKGASQQVIHRLEEAVELYRGSFLEGFSIGDSPAFEEWTLLNREQLHRLMMEALHRLADGYERRGEYERALQHTWRQVDLDPWREKAHRQLMRLLALNGQRGVALTQYETCRRLLAEELGVEPAEETTRLYEQIRDGKLQVPLPSPARPPAPAAGPPPYKGLQYFDQADADLFFGRELLTAKLVAHLAPMRGDRFLAVVGASGSGKSSIARAGLIPALKRGEPLADGTLPPTGCTEWPVRVITPTAHPLETLAVSLTRNAESVTTTTALMDDLAHDPRSLHLHVRRMSSLSLSLASGEGWGGGHLLLVDQFEELFTLCRNQAERQAFVDNLMTAVETDGPTVVVIALRADFYAHCGQFAPLREALEKRQVYIGPMSAEELRRAVTEPAEQGGWSFESGLVEFLLQEVGDEPGALPLLSHALLETWQRRRGRTLTFSGYSESGGVRGAIARTAERVLQGLEPEQQAIARNIFLRLTELGEGTQETRRRVKLAELVPRPEDAPTVEAVLRTLADARLITTSEDAVEVAHEALIREWPTLRGWLEEDREGLRIHRHLTETAQEWEHLNREPGELYRGARLAMASEWAAEHADELNPLEREFLEASQELARCEEAEREAQRQRELEAAQRVAAAERRRAEEQARATRRLKLGALLLAGVSVIAIVLAVIASGARSTAQQERDNAQREAAVNHSLVLASDAEEAFETGETDLALALALEAVNMDQPPPEARRTLSAIALGPGTRAVLEGHSSRVQDVAFSPDGQLALSGSCGKLDPNEVCAQGELILWDLEAGAELRQFEGHTHWVNGVAFSPDGKTALSGSGDAKLILWDVETGELIQRFKGHMGGVNSVAFSPDNQTALSASDDTTLILWNVATGEEIRRFEGHTRRVTCVAFSPDSQTALSSSDDATVILWDMVAGEEIRRFEGHEDEVTDVVFSPDGRTMLSTSTDHALRLWDLETGEEIRQQIFPSEPHSLAISPDGRTAVFNVDFEVRLWDIGQWQEHQRLLGHSGGIWSVAVSSDGCLGLSGAADGTLRLWNLGGQVEFRRFQTDGTPLIAVAVSPDGRRLLTGNMADETTLWDVERGEVIHRFESHEGAVSPGAVAFRPDGRYALVGSGDVLGGSGAKSLVLWDIETGEEVRRFEGHRFLVRSVAFGPDGRTALGSSQSMTSDEGDLILWNLETGEEIRRFDTTQDITSIVFSADGSRALTGSAYFSNLTIWDVSTGQEIRRFEGHTGPVFAVAFSPDEAAVLSASEDGSLVLWDVETGEIIRRYLGHDRGVWGLDVSPDGRHMISSSEDGTVILWNLQTGEELRRFSGHTAWVPDVVFNPDGQTAFSVSLDGTLIQWQIADQPLDELIEWVHANRYIRDLTCDERVQYRIEPPCNAEGVVPTIIP